ncbi:MAG: M1 family aminopeptidase [Fimbriimonas sp.]
MRIPVAAVALAFASLAGAQTRPHSYDLQHVRWEVSLHPEAGEVRGRAVNRLVPAAGARQIELDALGLKIESVEVGGKRTPYQHLNGKLRVDLPKAGDGKAAVDVAVRYSGRPQAGLYFIPASRAFPAKTPVVYTQGEMEDNRNWLPTYDYPDDKATSEGIVDVPKGWSVLANGALVERKDKGNRTVWHWRMDQAHSTYLISLVAGPYTETVERTTPIPVSHWVPTGLETWGEAAFGKTAPIVDFFGRLTGVTYPYAKYSQAAVPDYMFGGMENITCTTQTINALHPPSAAPIRDETGLVAHELAHQWFGDLVTTNGWSDIWINEGWASFLPSFWTRERHGVEAFDLDRYNTYQGAIGGSMEKPQRAMVDASYKDPIDMFDGLAYPGGAARMFMLMHLLGEETFWRTCKAYLEERKYTSFDTKAFFATWSKHSGKDLTPFMQQWFFTPGVPRLTVTRDANLLVIRQPSSAFKLDLPVWILDGETWIKREVKLEGRDARLDLGEHADKPALVDPEGWVLADINSMVPFTSAQRMALFKHAPNAASKARIIDRMVTELNPTERLAFARAIDNPELLRRYMGQLDKPEAEAFLLEKLGDADARTAQAAANTLARLPKGDAILAALEKAGNHPNDEVRFSAFAARLHLTNDATLADRAWTTPSYNDAFRRLALDWWAEHQPDRARTRALDAVRMGLPEPTRTHAIGMLGRLKDAAGKHEVYEALVKVVGESSFGARNTAINALADYGDKKAVPILEPLTRHPLVFLRNTAKGAVERLKG